MIDYEVWGIESDVPFLDPRKPLSPEKRKMVATDEPLPIEITEHGVLVHGDGEFLFLPFSKVSLKLRRKPIVPAIVTTAVVDPVPARPAPPRPKGKPGRPKKQ
jgi:hypothetical protein